MPSCLPLASVDAGIRVPWAAEPCCSDGTSDLLAEPTGEFRETKFSIARSTEAF